MSERYILIQNVDNLPGGNKEILRWKRAFMGHFAKIEEEIFKWVKLLKETDDLTGSKLEDAYTFITDKLKRPIDKKAKRELLFEAINRPLVLAAMVPNVGEPGGGPFAVKDPKTGTISNQIVEEAQQRQTDKKQLTIARKSTHFNPVFLMINTHDAWGNKFDLQKYARRDSGYVFFVEKTDSKGNKFASIDTGLWNGEIADMMILFVEMPLETFGPAKTVLDLSPEIRPFRKDPYPEIIK